MDDKTKTCEHMEQCWRHIGVAGDRSCPQLAEFGHCQNCPRYAKAGAKMLDRVPPDGYAREWAALLAEEKEEEARGTAAAVVFRLGEEWLALPTDAFKEVTEVGPVHTIPHRTNNILLGLVNVRGEIQLCVSIANLLGIEQTEPERPADRHRAYPRMVVIQRGGDRWVFMADEIQGTCRFRPDELNNVPVTVANAAASYTKGVLNWQDRSIGVLDEELVFNSLGRSVL